MFVCLFFTRKGVFAKLLVKRKSSELACFDDLLGCQQELLIKDVESGNELGRVGKGGTSLQVCFFFLSFCNIGCIGCSSFRKESTTDITRVHVFYLF